MSGSSRDRPVQPERAKLVGRHHAPRPPPGVGLDVAAPQSSVCPDRCAAQLAVIAEIDDVLPRAAEDLRHLTGGEKVAFPVHGPIIALSANNTSNPERAAADIMGEGRTPGGSSQVGNSPDCRAGRRPANVRGVGHRVSRGAGRAPFPNGYRAPLPDRAPDLRPPPPRSPSRSPPRPRGRRPRPLVRLRASRFSTAQLLQSAGRAAATRMHAAGWWDCAFTVSRGTA